MTQPGKERTVPILETNHAIVLCWCPPGEMLLGENEGKHPATFAKGLWIGKTQITQAQWKAVTGENPAHFQESNDLPVESVSWKDCHAFLEKLNKQVEGGWFLLPSETQWEYACRAGSGEKYCFGNKEDTLPDYAWFGESFETGRTHPVARKKPNAWGLHDLHGNVWEWCEDDWHYNYQEGPADGSAWGDEPRAERRVLRGGGWFFQAFSCRSASRIGGSPGSRYRGYGVRLTCVFP